MGLPHSPFSVWFCRITSSALLEKTFLLIAKQLFLYCTNCTHVISVSSTSKCRRNVPNSTISMLRRKVQSSSCLRQYR